MKLVREHIDFKRGLDPKKSIGIGTRVIIQKWFEKFAPDAEYEIDKDLNISVKMGLFLRYTSLTSLPDNLSIEGSLYLQDTNLTSLPDNLTVGKYLDLRGTNITSLPDSLTVGVKILKDF